LCEKPLTLSLAEADRAILAARQHGVPLMTGQFPPLPSPGGQSQGVAAGWQPGGSCGGLVTPPDNTRRNPGSWLSQRALGGGLALQYALHDLDWERWLAGEAAAVSAQEAHTNPEIDIEDNLWALVQFQNGSSGSVGVSWSCQDAYTERGVIGRRGTCDHHQRRLVGQLTRGKKIDINLGDGYDWRTFCARGSRCDRAVRTGQPFAITGEDGRATLELAWLCKKRP